MSNADLTNAGMMVAVWLPLIIVVIGIALVYYVTYSDQFQERAEEVAEEIVLEYTEDAGWWLPDRHPAPGPEIDRLRHRVLYTCQQPW